MNKSNNKKGAALIVFILFFTIASSSLVMILARGVFSDVMSANVLAASKQSYALADSFTEDMAYRFIAGLSPDSVETTALFGATATATVAFDSFNNLFNIITESNLQNYFRASELELSVGSGASFNFGIQTGNGGFEMSNSAEVIGNVFSNGPLSGGGSSLIRGDAISAGPSGFINGIHATGSAWAHTIQNSHIGKNLYVATAFDDIANVVDPGGLRQYSQPDQATTTLPIPDSVVDNHKASTTAAIIAGNGTLIASTDPECSSGTYVINVDTTFTGPTKIECDVSVQKNSTTLILEDTLWVSGNLSFSQGPTVEANPATSTNSILIIVDKEINRTTSSKIDIANGTIFVAATSPKSYIVLLSMNDSYENGGPETAISVAQSSNGDMLVYAGHGKITLANNIGLKEVTGYRITMGNNTVITYESGLLNLNFTSGPGGGFEINNWSETQ